LASITPPALFDAVPAPVSDSLNQSAMKVEYKKFTSQDEMGHFLVDHYKIRNPKDLASCEVCHR